MAFALPQIMVISTEGTLEDLLQATTQYMDILTVGALGNYAVQQHKFARKEPHFRSDNLLIKGEPDNPVSKF